MGMAAPPSLSTNENLHTVSRLFIFGIVASAVGIGHGVDQCLAIDIVEACGQPGERAVLTAERNGVLAVGGERRGGIDHGEVVALEARHVARELRGGGGGGCRQPSAVGRFAVTIVHPAQVAVRQGVARRPLGGEAVVLGERGTCQRLACLRRTAVRLRDGEAAHLHAVVSRLRRVVVCGRRHPNRPSARPPSCRRAQKASEIVPSFS